MLRFFKCEPLTSIACSLNKDDKLYFTLSLAPENATCDPWKALSLTGLEILRPPRDA